MTAGALPPGRPLCVKRIAVGLLAAAHSVMMDGSSIVLYFKSHGARARPGGHGYAMRTWLCNAHLSAMQCALSPELAPEKQPAQVAQSS